MNERLRDRILAVGVSALLAAGVWGGFRSFQETSALHERIETKRGQVEALRVDAESLRRDDALLARLTKDPRGLAPSPETLRPLLARHLTGVRVEIDVLEPQGLWEGWRLERAAIDLTEVAYARAAQFLAVVREVQPGWRLEAWEAVSGTTPGEGRLRMVFSGLANEEG